MSGGVLVLFLSLAPLPVRAAASNGGVLGWVEDSRGMPVAGAVISLFGGGANGAGLVTLSDSAGRFFLPSLPAGCPVPQINTTMEVSDSCLGPTSLTRSCRA